MRQQSLTAGKFDMVAGDHLRAPAPLFRSWLADGGKSRVHPPLGLRLLVLWIKCAAVFSHVYGDESYAVCYIIASPNSVACPADEWLGLAAQQAPFHSCERTRGSSKVSLGIAGRGQDILHARLHERWQTLTPSLTPHFLPQLQNVVQSLQLRE